MEKNPCYGVKWKKESKTKIFVYYNYSGASLVAQMVKNDHSLKGRFPFSDELGFLREA